MFIVCVYVERERAVCFVGVGGKGEKMLNEIGLVYVTKKHPTLTKKRGMEVHVATKHTSHTCKLTCGVYETPEDSARVPRSAAH